MIATAYAAIKTLTALEPSELLKDLICRTLTAHTKYAGKYDSDRAAKALAELASQLSLRLTSPSP